LTVNSHAAAVYACAAAFGLGYGGVFNAPPLIAFEFFGTDGVGLILGLFMLFFGLGTSSGGLVAGYLADAAHSYGRAFAWDLASSLIGLGLLALARRGLMRHRSAAPGSGLQL